MRDNAATKARRYLTEGRLIVQGVHGDLVIATCRGNGQLYQCGHTAERGWFCDCPARTDRCSHLEALRLVTVNNAKESTR